MVIRWSKLRTYVKPIVYRLRSRLLYRAANQYINVFDNDNDCEMATNGEARFARARLATASVAFDIGAAKGEWTKIALAANPDLQIHCFEPTSRRMKTLEDRKFGSRVVLIQLGLGAAEEVATIFYNASGGSNSLYPQRYGGEHYDAGDVESVKITTIDAYCHEHGIDHVDFVKMDIEGYEMAAIRGAERMLRQGRIDVLQFEYSSVFLDAGTSLMQLMKYVQLVNPAYVFHKIYPDGVQPVPRYTHDLDNFKMQNWALIKS
jgi:FkbM family methyltransferase